MKVQPDRVASHGARAEPPARLGVVIVNWNARELLGRCLDSVARHPPSVPHEVLVVDNASEDGSVAWLQRLAAERAAGTAPLRVLANAENVGFARANNLAFERSEAPLLLLLNPDAELTAGAVDALLATLAGEPRAAACAPRLLNTDRSLQPSVWPAPPTTLQVLVQGLRLDRLLPSAVRARWLRGAHWDHSTRQEVDAFFGAAMLVRRAALDDVGPFDESFALFGEDLEWCARARRAGWRLIFEPAAEVLHHGGRSAGQRWSPGEVERLKAEANIRFQRRALGPVGFVANQLAYAVTQTAIGAWRALRRRPAGTQLAIGRMHWAAAWRPRGRRAAGGRRGALGPPR